MRRLGGTARIAALAVVAVSLLAPATGHAHKGRVASWTVRQAESIREVRSMPVHVLECRGLGRALVREGASRFRHFRCTAGTRAPWERYDTIAVFYVLHPLDCYRSERPRYSVTNVRFVGGPGIP